MLDADPAGPSEPADGWHQAGAGFTDHHNRAGEPFSLTVERRYRIVDDQLEIEALYTGDEGVAVDDITLALALDGLEFVMGPAATELELEPGAIETHTFTLRASRDGVVGVRLEQHVGDQGGGSYRLRLVAEDGHLRTCEENECSAPASAAATTAEDGSTPTIVVELINTCAVPARFVLGPPGYPEVRPPDDAPIHELAAGGRESLAIVPNQWLLRANEDGKIGGGVKTDTDGARIEFSGGADSCDQIAAVTGKVPW